MGKGLRGGEIKEGEQRKMYSSIKAINKKIRKIVQLNQNLSGIRQLGCSHLGKILMNSLDLALVPVLHAV